MRENIFEHVRVLMSWKMNYGRRNASESMTGRVWIWSIIKQKSAISHLCNEFSQWGKHYNRNRGSFMTEQRRWVGYRLQKRYGLGAKIDCFEQRVNFGESVMLGVGVGARTGVPWHRFSRCVWVDGPAWFSLTRSLVLARVVKNHAKVRKVCVF